MSKMNKKSHDSAFEDDYEKLKDQYMHDNHIMINIPKTKIIFDMQENMAILYSKTDYTNEKDRNMQDGHEWQEDEVDWHLCGGPATRLWSYSQPSNRYLAQATNITLTT